MATIHFFIGKGGVGKSTLSCLSAAYLSAVKKKKTLLVSLDPAHNLSDIFQVRLKDRVTALSEKLLVKEIDEKKRIKSYLKEMERHLSKTYSYQTAFNLQGYFTIIRHSPGIEEYSLLTAFNTILKKYADMDHIIFDMPPTALTLKFLRLPSLSLIWLNKLRELRQEIIDKKEIISRIKFGKREFQRDKILKRLEESISNYSAVNGMFQDHEHTRLHIVAHDDSLSRAETAKIARELKDMRLKARDLIINRHRAGAPAVHTGIRSVRTILVPDFPESPAGLAGITRTAKGLSSIMSFLEE